MPRTQQNPDNSTGFLGKSRRDLMLDIINANVGFNDDMLRENFLRQWRKPNLVLLWQMVVGGAVNPGNTHAARMLADADVLAEISRRMRDTVMGSK